MKELKKHLLLSRPAAPGRRVAACGLDGRYVKFFTAEDRDNVTCKQCIRCIERRIEIYAEFVDDKGESLYGSCSACGCMVDNYDELHRVTSIVRGGRGVECVKRGDIDWSQAQPLGRRVTL